VTYVEHNGDADVLPGVRLLPTPGHTAGHQAVLVDTAAGSVVIGGDVAYTFKELGQAKTAGQRRVLDLGLPTWLAHVDGPPRIPRAAG
jgi:N-acyl homoserine lactone hydrolase